VVLRAYAWADSRRLALGSLRFGPGQDLDAVGGGQPGEASRVGRDGYGQAQIYQSVIAQIALRTLREIFASTPKDMISTVVFNGRVHDIDPLTGQKIQPHLITLRATREKFTTLILDEPKFNPVECVRRYFFADISPHPDELIPVEPYVGSNKYRSIRARRRGVSSPPFCAPVSGFGGHFRRVMARLCASQHGHATGSAGALDDGQALVLTRRGREFVS
jgi:hypothetical protein